MAVNIPGRPAQVKSICGETLPHPSFFFNLFFYSLWFEHCFLANVEEKSLKCFGKKGNFNIYSSMITGQTPPVDDKDHVIRSEAPGLLLNGPFGEIVFSNPTSKVEN